MLMQRFGRGGRGPETEATGIYLVESQHFDHAKKKGKRSRRKVGRKGRVKAERSKKEVTPLHLLISQ